MFNTKKILMVVTASVLGLGLSGCGKDNYNGQYTGSEIQMPQQQPQQQQPGSQYYPQNYGMQQQQYRQLTVNLSHNGDIVTGDYTAAANTAMGMGTQYPSQYPTQYPQTGMLGAAETYRLEATAKDANRLDDVRLIPTSNNMYGSACVLQGSLTAVDDGARLQGTLSPVNVSTQTSSIQLCLPRQVTLDRVGER
jgi:hypothetical protein